MKAGVLFSGGKDSCFAAHICHFLGFEAVLFSVVPADKYDMIYHYPNIIYTKLQAEAMGLEHVFIRSGDDNLSEALVKNNIKALFTGGIRSDFQRWHFHSIANVLGLPLMSPLWLKNKKYYQELSDSFSCIFVRVAAEGLGKEFLGKPIKTAAHIKGVDKFFEGGEAESFVVDAPLFKRRIEISQYEIITDGMCHTLAIKGARLVEKKLENDSCCSMH